MTSPAAPLNSRSKVALITGSTSGIGLAIARRFASDGHAVMLHGLAEPPELESLAGEFARTYGTRVATSSADLSNPAAARDLVMAAIRELGEVDVLINNAGVQHTAPVEDFPLERWEFILNVNLTAAFAATAACVPGMKARRRGRIINLASAHGLVASPMKSAYVASKHGLIGFTKAVALELAPVGVTCNALCPGWVKTPLVDKQIQARAAADKISIERAERDLLLEKQPTGRFVTADEIASCAAFLASDAAASITGASLAVDGGWTAR